MVDCTRLDCEGWRQWAAEDFNAKAAVHTAYVWLARVREHVTDQTRMASALWQHINSTPVPGICYSRRMAATLCAPSAPPQLLEREGHCGLHSRSKGCTSPSPFRLNTDTVRSSETGVSAASALCPVVVATQHGERRRYARGLRGISPSVNRSYHDVAPGRACAQAVEPGSACSRQRCRRRSAALPLALPPPHLSIARHFACFIHKC